MSDTIFDRDLPNIHGVRPSQILAGEAAGSKNFRSQELMLVQPSSKSNEADIAAYYKQLIALGFVLGKQVDDLFMEATFPQGWTKTAQDDDPRHITVRDDKGRDRIYIFYKDTYYDRYANCRIPTRLSRDYQHIDENGKDTKGYTRSKYFTVKDSLTNKELFRGSYLVKHVPGDYEEMCKQEKIASKERAEWLDVNYPDIDNPLAYWDLEF